MAKKSTQAQAFFLELDQVTAAFQDLDSDWEGSFDRYYEILELLNKESFLRKVSRQPDFETRLDALEMAMALHPAADPVKVGNISFLPEFKAIRGKGIIEVKTSFYAANYSTTIRGLSNNPCLPLWHDIGDDKFVEVAQRSIFFRICGVMGFIYARHDFTKYVINEDDADLFMDDLYSKMQSELDKLLVDIGVHDPISLNDFDYDKAMPYVRSAEEPGLVLKFAALTDRLCQIAQVPKRYRSEHLYGYLLPE